MSIKSILGTEFQLSANQQMAIFAAAGLIIGAAASGKIPYPMGTEAAAPYIQSWANSIQFLWGIAGGPILMAFANSKPGPLAPPDPPVVQVATEKAKDMGQIAKALFVAILFIGAFGAFDHAHAATVHHAKALPNPFTPFTPPSATNPAVSTADPLANIMNKIMAGKTDVVNDLTQALNTQAAVINPATNASWDPYSVMCLNGVAAQGTEGQPGFLPASQGLIAWINGLQAPAASSVPPLPDNPSAATLLVHARLLLLAANSDVNMVLIQVQTTGIPGDLKKSCGALINDTTTQAQNLITQAGSLALLLGKFVH